MHVDCTCHSNALHCCCRRSLADRLAVAMGLSAGAVGTSGLAQADDADAPRTPHTVLLPEHYEVFEGGTAVFALESGEQLSLTSDQYVLLDGGLLLVVDELVQNHGTAAGAGVAAHGAAH